MKLLDFKIRDSDTNCNYTSYRPELMDLVDVHIIADIHAVTTNISTYIFKNYKYSVIFR